MMENIYVLTSLIMMVFFLMLAAIFQILKGKACILLAGYNNLSKEERKEYDEDHISSDMKKYFMNCSAFFIGGAISSHIFGAIGFWLGVGMWFIYFLRSFHIDIEKAFGKYKNRKVK